MTYTEPLLLLFGALSFLALVPLRHARIVRLPLAATATLLLLCWPPVEWLLSRPLEAWYPVRPY